MSDHEGTLIEHRISFLYECRSARRDLRPNLTGLTLSEPAITQAGPDWLDPIRLNPGHPRNLTRQPVWQVMPLPLSPDLHPLIGSILSTTGKSGLLDDRAAATGHTAPIGHAMSAGHATSAQPEITRRFGPERPRASQRPATQGSFFCLTAQARNLIQGQYRPEPLEIVPAEIVSPEVKPGGTVSAGNMPAETVPEPSPQSGEAPRRRSGGLFLGLGSLAARHLGLDPDIRLPVRLEQISFLPFRTGIGIAVIELRVLLHGNPAPAEKLLIEAVHLLADERRSRPRRLSWDDGEVSDGEREIQAFHLSDLLRPLLAGAGIEVMGERRVFTYATAVARQHCPPAARQDIAFRLSRHYNYTYDPGLRDPGLRDRGLGGSEELFYHPFTNVTHAVNLEGAATLIDLPEDRSGRDGDDSPASGSPEFLSNWVETAYRPVYLPIVIIAYHEYLALLDLAQTAAMDVDFSNFTDRQAADLQRLCHRFLAFRLRYRPAQVSRITMHNTFSDLVRQALGIEQLSRKAAQDAAEAERRLSQHAAHLAEKAREAAKREAALQRAAQREIEQQRERRWAWHGALISGLLAMLTVLSLVKQISEYAETRWGEAYTSVTGAYHLQDLALRDIVTLAGFVIAALSGAIGFWVARGRLGSGHDMSEEVEEDSQDHMLDESFESISVHRDRRL